MTKKVTIVLATYNGELFLREQLDSILNQSYKDYKVVIRDDASNDNTVKILREYQQSYPAVFDIIVNSKQLGVVMNFEKLIEDATTEYIALCDQDDIWHQDKLLKGIFALEALSDSERPLLFASDLKVINEEGKGLYESFFKMRGYTFPLKRSIDIMLGRSGMMGNTMVLNQSLKKYILPFPKMLIVHDYWISLVNEVIGQRIVSSEILLSYRIHQNNTSKSFRTKLNIRNRLKRENIRLPYHGIKREEVLKEFLERFSIDKEDKKIIDDFLNYLYFRKNKLFLLKIIFKYNFFRIGISYKLKLYGAFLWKKK